MCGRVAIRHCGAGHAKEAVLGILPQMPMVPKWAVEDVFNSLRLEHHAMVSAETHSGQHVRDTENGTRQGREAKLSKPSPKTVD